MPALGELLVLMIYIILSIPVMIMFIRFIKINDKRRKIWRLIWTVILAVPLILYSYTQSTSHLSAELEYVGMYELTEYPGCVSCKLELMSNNHYIVRNGQKVVEKGKWKYRSGGDYWIVDIGEMGQLGTGNYSYK